MSGLYNFRLSNEETVHIATRKRFGDFNICLNYDDETFRFDKTGAVTSKNEHLLRRIEVALQHGFALPLNQIRNDEDWMAFVRENIFSVQQPNLINKKIA